MQSRHTLAPALAAALLAVGLAGCGNLSSQDKSTLAGTGIGAASGAILSGGGAAATIGGAAVGGIIGHEVGKDDEKK